MSKNCCANAPEKCNKHYMSDNTEKEKVLSRAFNLLQQLPTGEIFRAIDVLERKVLNWDGVIKQAPELFRDRKASEKLPAFLTRVYVRPGYLNGKMTIAHLSVLDSALGAAVRAWISHHGELRTVEENGEESKPIELELKHERSHGKPGQERRRQSTDKDNKPD